ncbi:MAG: TatD DNase family protein [Pseudomonadota bacterium]
MLVDTHCHLDFLRHPLDSLRQAASEGVAGLVIPAVEPGNFSRVRDWACQMPGGVYALGLHPCSLDRLGDDSLALLKTELLAVRADPRLAALGEIGLDFFVPGLDRTHMTHLFHEQLRLARDFDLPVVLHVRRAQDQVLAGLRRFGIRRGIAHAFNGSLDQAKAYRRQGIHLGLGGAMTFTRASRIRALAQQMPLEAFVLETDSPDIPPAWLAAGEENTPVEVRGVAQCLAELRGLAIHAVEEATTQAACEAIPALTPLLSGR